MKVVTGSHRGIYFYFQVKEWLEAHPACKYLSSSQIYQSVIFDGTGLENKDLHKDSWISERQKNQIPPSPPKNPIKKYKY